VAVGLRDPPRSEDSTAPATREAVTEGDAEHEPAEPGVPADGSPVDGDFKEHSSLLRLPVTYQCLPNFFFNFFSVRSYRDYYALLTIFFLSVSHPESGSYVLPVAVYMRV
jgi:hypothetical protein